MKPIAKLKVRMIACLAMLVMLDSSTAWAGTGFWTSLGLEERSIMSLAIDPKNPDTIYVGTKRGGRCPCTVLKSTNGGSSWSEMSFEFSAGVVALVLDSENPATIYAATWGNGLFKSDDGGETWANRLSQADFDRHANFIPSVALDPKDSRTVYAGSASTCCPESSWVFKSTDAGISWKASHLATADIRSLAIDPQDSRIVYAGQDGEPEGGISKSVDAGITWADVGIVMNGHPYVSNLGIDPVNSGTIYAATMIWDGGDGYVIGVFRSSDGGASWLNTGPSPPAVDPQYRNWVSAVAIDPIHPATLYAAVNTGLWTGTAYAGRVYGSTNGGTSWVDTGLDAPEITSLAIDPQKPDRIVAGTIRGLFARNVHPLLTLDSIAYCIGDAWNLQVGSAEPSAVVRLLGTSNSKPWEITEWLKTDVHGSVSITGEFAEGTQGAYTLTIEIAGVRSNTLSFVVSNCKP